SAYSSFMGTSLRKTMAFVKLYYANVKTSRCSHGKEGKFGGIAAKNPTGGYRKTRKSPQYQGLSALPIFIYACLSLKSTGIGKKISGETAYFAVSTPGRSCIIRRQGSGGSHGRGWVPHPPPAQSPA